MRVFQPYENVAMEIQLMKEFHLESQGFTPITNKYAKCTTTSKRIEIFSYSSPQRDECRAYSRIPTSFSSRDFLCRRGRLFSIWVENAREAANREGASDDQIERKSFHRKQPRKNLYSFQLIYLADEVKIKSEVPHPAKTETKVNPFLANVSLHKE
eukprot:TRINITY_DN6744_c0_g1_i3.p2 TRINITY_DN6744_c0_g1~~TRINITY_DN6744_c0_g1_i3.p2  ORF type:complete len:156 (+),score=14.58 TRINITY_DN6744_c0_g1_i3:567-1034(+)